MSSGDHSANPATPCASGRSGLRRAHISRATRKRSGLRMPAPSEESFRVVSSDASCRFAVSGRRSDCTTKYQSRKQSREAGTSSRFLTVWKLLPNISCWDLQFGSRLPRFMGVFSTEVAPQQVLVMEQEVKALLVKGAIEYVPHSNRETGLLSRYFIILIIISIIAPHFHFQCIDAALAPLYLQGIHIMNYIDDWLILAQSYQLAVRYRDVILAHMKEFGLRLNAKKSVLSPLQMTTFLGMALDSTLMQVFLSPAHIESILLAVKNIRLGQSLTVKQFQRLLGLMAAASNMIPFGLLYMRPLQWWLRTKGFSLRGNPFCMIKVMQRC